MGKLSDSDLRSKLNKKYLEASIENDGEGLGARVSKLGKIRWQYRYKIKGKSKRLDLGNYPALSLKKAREEAQRCREWLVEGYDPKIQRELVRNKTLNPVTIKDALEYWLINYAEDNRDNVSKHRAQFQKHIYPYIGNFPLDRTETRHWVECFDRIRRGVKGKQRAAPVAAGYILQNAKQALRFCRIRHYGFSRALDDLTVVDVGKKQEERDRVLTNKELIDVLHMAFECGHFSNQYYRNLLRILITFGSRTQEARLSTWAEWDFDQMLWTVPKEHSKNKEKIFRPIPEEVKGWLLDLKGNAHKSDRILGQLKTAETVSQYTRLLWMRFRHEEKWTVHDLRRTLATGMSDLGIAPHVVEQLLGHKLGGVMQIYNRSRYLPEKKEALKTWLEYLGSLTNGHESVFV